MNRRWLLFLILAPAFFPLSLYSEEFYTSSLDVRKVVSNRVKIDWKSNLKNGVFLIYRNDGLRISSPERMSNSTLVAMVEAEGMVDKDLYRFPSYYDLVPQSGKYYYAVLPKKNVFAVTDFVANINYTLSALEIVVEPQEVMVIKEPEPVPEPQPEPEIQPQPEVQPEPQPTPAVISPLRGTAEVRNLQVVFRDRSFIVIWELGDYPDEVVQFHLYRTRFPVTDRKQLDNIIPLAIIEEDFFFEDTDLQLFTPYYYTVLYGEKETIKPGTNTSINPVYFGKEIKPAMETQENRIDVSTIPVKKAKNIPRKYRYYSVEKPYIDLPLPERRLEKIEKKEIKNLNKTENEVRMLPVETNMVSMITQESPENLETNQVVTNKIKVEKKPPFGWLSFTGDNNQYQVTGNDHLIIIRGAGNKIVVSGQENKIGWAEQDKKYRLTNVGVYTVNTNGVSWWTDREIWQGSYTNYDRKVTFESDEFPVEVSGRDNEITVQGSNHLVLLQGENLEILKDNRRFVWKQGQLYEYPVKPVTVTKAKATNKPAVSPPKKKEKKETVPVMEDKVTTVSPPVKEAKEEVVPSPVVEWNATAEEFIIPASAKKRETKTKKSRTTSRRVEKTDSYTLGVNKFARKDFREAIKYFSQSGNPESDLYIGKSYYYLSDYGNALKYFARYSRIDPAKARLWKELTLNRLGE